MTKQSFGELNPERLTKGILERALHAEMSEHLGYSKYDRAETENARNGSFSKNLIVTNEY
uniref:transposase n=1 Tax=Rickettsia endosymbiont of Urophora cardui TaxID=3066265 RepID=UPI00313CAFAE